MQTAVDYNGSKSNNNGSSYTTTLTMVDDGEKSGVIMQTTTASSNAQSAVSMTTTMTKATMLVNEPTNVLRNRIQGHKDHEHNAANMIQIVKTPIKTSSTSISVSTNHRCNSSKDSEYQCLQPQLEMSAEYSGSNVQQIAVTPSSSPRASPTKPLGNGNDNESTKFEVFVTDIGSDSNTSSTTNSSNSSVLATPIMMRGYEKPKIVTTTCVLRNVGVGVGAGVSNILSSEAKDGECSVVLKRPLPPKTLPLPLKTGAFGSFHDFEMTTPYTPTSSSSTSASTPSQEMMTPSPSASQITKSIDYQLLQWKDMPQYLQFNPYVLNGYRPLQTFKGCLLSLFYWHNETINILTHGALPFITSTTLCFSFKWKWFIIISYCLLSIWGLYKALTASSPWQRRLCFALPFCMRSILTFLRTLGLVGGNRVALSHVYLQDGVSILGGAIGAMRIPEKWFPGLMDFYLNSHNIMHVLVVVAVYSMHKATMKDLEWMSETTCEAFSNATNEAITESLSSNIEL